MSNLGDAEAVRSGRRRVSLWRDQLPRAGGKCPTSHEPGNARVHHHLLDPSRSDLGLEFVSTMWWIMELKLLGGGSGKTRKCELDAAEVVSLGRVCASETLNKDRQSGETSARFP